MIIVKKWIAAFVLVVLALVFLVSAWNLPWYYQVLESENPFTGDVTRYNIEYFLTDVDLEVTSGNNTERSTLDYDEEPLESEGLGPVFAVVDDIMLLTLVLTIFLFIAMIIVAVKKGRGGFVCTILAGMIIIALVFVVAYTAVGIPKAFDESYDSTDTEGLEKPGYTRTFFGGESGIVWGGGWGWYEAIIVIMLILIIMVLVRSSARAARADEIRAEQMWLDRERRQYGETVPLVMDAEVVPEIKTLECPGCQEKFKVKITSRPVKVKCPRCGMIGHIK